ncbi:MAG TPA: GAF and ANTAR domain-containing protein [Egicoccus sp.]|nr:GAF and ANTAR domain-containing protein [Egicoccus sp.]HSK22062.1 GAF and ANTAR domain-containing protein [Egicoccus sp.]
MPGSAAPDPDEDLIELMTEPDVGYATALSRLSGLLLDTGSLETILQGVVDGVKVAVPQLSAVSITTVGEDGGYTTAVATDERAVAVDNVEYDLHLGPCVEALETGEDQYVDDVRTDTRWGPFNDEALRQGFLSAAGIALKANGQTYGALNLFADTAAGIDERTRDLVHRLAPTLAATLANARAFTTAERLSRQLEERLEDIAVLHQAVGILMAERGCDAVTATTLLHETATATSRPLHDVAAQIVAATVRGGGSGPVG